MSFPSRNGQGKGAVATQPRLPKAAEPKGEHEILFQNYFKSVGPRTYATQVKKANNGNHYIVLTEGKRDETGEVRKTRLFVFGEDFAEFFRMVKGVAEFVKATPVPEEVKEKRAKFWARQGNSNVPVGSAKAPPTAAAR